MSRPLTKQFTTTLLLANMCLLLSACSVFGGDNQPVKMMKAPAAKQVYTVPEAGIADFETLDPALASDTASLNVVQMLFTGLVQLNNHLQIRPQLAQSWNQANDGVTWTFHLKSGLKFSDGRPLTASDVVYSINRALSPATQSTVAPLYLGLIKNADALLANRTSTLIGASLLAPDQHTVVITTRKKATYFLSALTSPCAYVLEKSFVSKYGKQFTEHLTQGGGSGPFTVSQYTHRQKIDFVPNIHYYNAKPLLRRVTFTFFHSANDAYQAYQDGRIDTTGVPLSIFDTEKKRHDFHQIPQLWTNYYTMNYLVKPFDNIHIRQAFALAINKTHIADTVWKGSVLPTNHIVPQGMPGYNATLTGPDGTQNLKGNPTKAQALLKQGLREEGWSSLSQLPAITLTYAKTASFPQEVAALVQMWHSTLNVTVKTNAVDYDALLDKVTASTNNPQGLQFWGLAWVGEYPDPHDWLTLQFGRGVPNNNMNYGQGKNDANQQQVQLKLETADALTGESERLHIYQQAEQQLVNDVAWLPMEQVTTTLLRTPTIVGIVDNAQGIIPPDDWANIYRIQPAE